ncbi:MAG: type II toxin-antitoxin system Phd/YefM family antitoxin [Nitrospirae bacterium]|nr:MAG: type II toxin-antitoxin system Phd/YefM family antitoxin [Nitrospirota bacterium]
MRLAGVKELKQQTMELLKETAKGDIIITAHGKPMAVLHHVTEDDLSDYLIEHDPAFKTKIESHRRQGHAGHVETETCRPESLGSFTALRPRQTWNDLIPTMPYRL